MPVRTTLQIGDSRLKAANQAITDFANPKLHQLVADLTDTMRHEELIGIAAPQIGENYQVFVTEPRETKLRSKDQTDKLRVYINPLFTYLSAEETIIYEGCGSVLHGQLFGPVKRPQLVTVAAFGLEGRKFSFTADGILGRVIQHEYDHLVGVEFLEKVFDYRKLMSVDHYLEQIKHDPEHVAACEITRKEVGYL